MHDAIIMLCNWRRWFMQSIQGCYPGVGDHVGGASAAAAAAAGPAGGTIDKTILS